MEVRNMRQFGQIVCGTAGLALLSTPVFAQEQASQGAGLDLVDMFAQMGPVAWGVAIVLFIMSFWSVGIAIERIYTYNRRASSRRWRAAGGQASPGWPLEGGHCAVGVEGLSLQPLGEGRACRSAGVSVPAGERLEPEPR